MEGRRGGRRWAPATLVLAAVLGLVYFGFQGGDLSLGAPGGIEFRCNAVDYGLIPYEATHPGERLTDPWCQAQPESLLHGGEEAAAEEDEHDHPRGDPGIEADAPTWLTFGTSVLMHGGLLHLGVSIALVLLCGRALERRVGALRMLALFAAGGLLSAAALVVLAPSLPIATIGAGGAVAALVGACARDARRSTDGVPATALVGAWALLQVAILNVDAAQPVAGAGGDIAYLAPVAGLLAGAFAAPVMQALSAGASRTGRARAPGPHRPRGAGGRPAR